MRAWRAEVLLELVGIGHGEGRAVDQQRAVPTPEAVGERRGRDRGDQPARQRTKQFQGQPGAGLTVGTVGEGAVGPEADVLDRGVAVQDLPQEPVKDGRGRQATGPPGVPDEATGVVNGVFVEPAGKVLPQIVQRDINASMHPRASCAMGRVTTPWCREALVILKPFLKLDLGLA